MPKFEAWLAPSAGSLHVRVVEIAATTERHAYQQAKTMCQKGEIVRGVLTIATDEEIDNSFDAYR
jgi:hypothetical protein